MSAIPDEQAALLSAIIAHPDDDTPRLVYADWLQEHGDEEQAQFIRDSIKLATMKPRAKGRKALHARLEKLAKVRGGVWVKGVGLEYVDRLWPSADFERGLFMDATYWDLDAFFAEAPTLFARVPVRKLYISEPGRAFNADALRAIAAMPELSRLRHLGFFNDNWYDLSLDGWNALIRSPFLSGLREFYPTAFGLLDEHLFALADCPNMASLTSLDLSGNEFSPEAQLAILNSPHLTGLKRLSLDNGNDPEDEELIDLVTARFGSDAPLLMSITDQQ